jgi:hypothetical protein
MVAIVVINIIPIGGSGDIIANAVVVPAAVSTIPIIAIIVGIHRDYPIVVVLLLFSNHCPRMPPPLSSTLSPLAAAAASLPSPSPSPSLSPPLPSLPSLSTLLRQCCFTIVLVVVLLGGQLEELDQTMPQRHCPWHADGAPTLGLVRAGRWY